MKGKFPNETAERLYGEWSESLHTSDCFDGNRWYVLFVDFDGGDAHILTQDEQGFVDYDTYPDEEIMQAWHTIVDRVGDEFEVGFERDA